MTEIGPTELYAVLRSAIAKCGSQQAFAEKHFISPAHVCDVLNGRREPGAKILGAIGYRRINRFQPILEIRT